jgi:hypothetical protein
MISRTRHIISVIIGVQFAVRGKSRSRRKHQNIGAWACLRTREEASVVGSQERCRRDEDRRNGPDYTQLAKNWSRMMWLPDLTQVLEGYFDHSVRTHWGGDTVGQRCQSCCYYSKSGWARKMVAAEVMWSNQKGQIKREPVVFAEGLRMGWEGCQQ